MITKKDIIELAWVIKNSNNKDNLVKNLISYLKTNNPNFSEDKFRKAIE